MIAISIYMEDLKLFLRDSKIILLLILVSLFFSGCITTIKYSDGCKTTIIGSSCTAPVVVTPANYSELSIEDKQKIVTLESFSSVDYEKINKITGAQLREQLKNDSLAVVSFCNTCTARQKYSDDWGKGDYKLYLMMESYAPMYPLLENKTRPIFSIDMEYYNSNDHVTCLKYFVNDLLERDLDVKFYKDYVPSFLYFKNGELIQIDTSSKSKNKKNIREISYEQLLKKE